MTDGDIEKLLGDFFEGNTSNMEEEALYDYFASGEYPEHLARYAPLFDCFKNELHRLPLQAPVPEPARGRKLVRCSVAALIAASVVLAIVNLPFSRPVAEPDPFEGSYMIVNGEKITDMDILMPEIEKTLALVSRIRKEMDAANEVIHEQSRIHSYYLNHLEQFKNSKP